MLIQRDIDKKVNRILTHIHRIADEDLREGVLLTLKRHLGVTPEKIDFNKVHFPIAYRSVKE